MATTPPSTEPGSAVDSLAIDDPSILSGEKMKKKPSNQKPKKAGKKKDTNVAESSQKNMNAITRFLESAAAAAAEEEPQSTDDVPRASTKNVEEIFITIPRRVLLHQYEPEELLSLRDTVPPTELKIEVPGEDFWRLRASKPTGRSFGPAGESHARWNSAYGNSSGSSTGEMGSFSISGKGNDRKRNNNREKRRGGKGGESGHQNANRRYGNKEDEDETPEWMLENDEPVGNSALDFEKWKAKMKLEERKANGEDISEAEVNQLSSGSGPHLSAPPGLVQTESKNSIDNFFSFYKEEPKKVDEAHGSSSSLSQQDSRAGESNGGSRFSSFFGGANGSPAPTASTQNRNITPSGSQGSKLLSMINGAQSTSSAPQQQSPQVASQHVQPQPAQPQYPQANDKGSPNQTAANSLLNSIGAATSNNNIDKSGERRGISQENSPVPHQLQLQQQQQQQQHYSQSPLAHQVDQNGAPTSKKNDVFFASLLSKQVPSPGGNAPRPQPNSQQQPMRPLGPQQIPQFMNGPPPGFYNQGPPPPWLMQNGGAPGPQFQNDPQRFAQQQFPGQQKVPFPPMGPPPGFPVMYQQPGQRPNQQLPFNPEQVVPPPYFQQQLAQQHAQPGQHPLQPQQPSSNSAQGRN